MASATLFWNSPSWMPPVSPTTWKTIFPACWIAWPICGKVVARS